VQHFLPEYILDACRATLWVWLASNIVSNKQAWCHRPWPRLSQRADETAAGSNVHKHVNECQQKLEHDIVINLERTHPALLDDNMECELQEAEDLARRVSVKRLLLAYALYRPDVGYCQGMNVVAAELLSVVAEHSALLVLCGLLARLPADLHCLDLERLTACREEMQGRAWRVLSMKCPRLIEHFKAKEVDANVFLARWLSTLFAGVLPSPATVRLWDHVLGDGGENAVLCMSVGILIRAEKQLLEAEDLEEMKELIDTEAAEVATAVDVDRVLRFLPVHQLLHLERVAKTAAGVPHYWMMGARNPTRQKRPRLLKLLCSLMALILCRSSCNASNRRHVDGLQTSFDRGLSAADAYGLLDHDPSAPGCRAMRTAQGRHSKRIATSIIWQQLPGDWMPPPPHRSPPDPPDAAPDGTGGQPPPPCGPDGPPSPKQPDPDPFFVVPPGTQQKSIVDHEEPEGHLQDDGLGTMTVTKLRGLIHSEGLDVKKNVGGRRSRRKHEMISDIRREREALQRPPTGAAGVAYHRPPLRPALPTASIPG